ncbi:MAG: hypothetical protein QOH26_2103, partial [Actinomycetota bacterium]|nr:hypothetical protein [Actinomycetota bacterium]
DEWLNELATALGVEADMDETELLDVARVVAHGVERRAAPLTTFLIGLAAGRTGAQVGELCAKTTTAAEAFSSKQS